jgi:hypothetical protein
MIVFDKYVVMPDGNLMIYNTGEIVYPKANHAKQLYFNLVDEDGANHFFLQSNLLKLKKKLEKDDADKGIHSV